MFLVTFIDDHQITNKMEHTHTQEDVKPIQKRKGLSILCVARFVNTNHWGALTDVTYLLLYNNQHSPVVCFTMDQMDVPAACQRLRAYPWAVIWMGQQVTRTKKGSAVIVWKHLLWFRNVSSPYHTPIRTCRYTNWEFVPFEASLSTCRIFHRNKHIWRRNYGFW